MNPLAAIGVIVLLVVAAFVGGCYRGEHNGESDRLLIAAQRDNAIAGANTCGQALERVNVETARGIAEAEARARRGELAVVEAELAAANAQAQADSASRALTAAKRQPICRAQLETPLCADIPLL